MNNKSQYAYTVLIGIFQTMNADRVLWRYDRHRFHTFFSDKKRQEDFPQIIGFLNFYNGVTYKHCPDLEDALSMMRSQGVLCSWGPYFNPQEYLISGYGRDIVNENFPANSIVRGQLEKLTAEFEEQFKMR